MHYKTDKVLQIFSLLNRSSIPYLLLRNTGDELPHNLKIGKDIDVLVAYSHRKKLLEYLFKVGMKSISHPHKADIKLYGVHEFEKFKNNDGLLLDINYEITVRSLDAGQWIPLDQMIQKSAWKNSKVIVMGRMKIPTLCAEDSFVTTLAHCFFNKKTFSTWHQGMLLDLFSKIDVEKVKAKLSLVFYKYTNRLIECIIAHNFDGIVDDYLSFKGY